jgi:hypothetical protein
MFSFFRIGKTLKPQLAVTKSELQPQLHETREAADETSVSFDSAAYWSDRYRANGNSGAGSYGRLAGFKADVINGFVRDRGIDSIIEFGCGDGAQLTRAEYPDYLGFDVADEAIELCRNRFAGDVTKEFRNVATYKHDRADVTLSLDVIYHLIEDGVFHEYMRRLFFSANKYVIVYSSNYDGDWPAVHVKHRKFTDWVSRHQADFKLIEKIPNRYPLVDDEQTESFAEFFIFERQVPRRHTLPGHLVVSITSYAKRFPTLELTLRRILQQTIKPDEILLWIAPEDAAQLPPEIVELHSSGVSIRLTRDIRSYKKIVPAREHYPNSFIITFDDDVDYPLDAIESLVKNYRSPREILCRRANKISFGRNGKPLPYNKWQFDIAEERAGPDLLATGCGGILYPPQVLQHPDVLDEAAFRELAPTSDDLWLFWMAHLSGDTIRRVGAPYPLRLWPGCDEQGLWATQNSLGGNDRAIAALSERYGWPVGPGSKH